MAARTKVFVDIITKADGKDAGKAFKKFAVGAGVAAVAVAGLVKVAKVWSDAASDAEEIGSKYATIFRDIRGEAEAMADKFAESFGLAGSTSRELLGNTADLLTGLGFTQKGALDLSEQVNTLAADLASFSNFAGGTTGASEALTKALLGEAESAKALGIVINQNTQEYKDAIKFYTEVQGLTLLQAKAYTALQFATEQSGNAIGDVARTFESHANVTRRLEESTKSLKEELGVAVNKGLTPMLSITDKLVKKMADWLQKSNELTEAIERFENGTADGEQSVAALNNELINQVIQMKALQDAVNLNIAGSEAAVEAQKKRIEQTQILIGVAARAAALEAQGAALSEETAKQRADAAEKEATAAKEAAADLEALQDAFAGTHEGQVKALETQIAFFETFREGPMSIAVLADLNTELEKLTEKAEILNEIDFKPGKEEEIRLREKATKVQKEEIEKTEELNTAVVAAGDSWLEIEQKKIDHLIWIDNLQIEMNNRRLTEAAKEQAEIDKTIDKYKGFIDAGLSPLIEAFDNVGDAGANTWEVMKQAGKDAISGILKAFAEMWTVRAVASLAVLNFVSAAGFTAAAIAATAASSTVQNFAHGGQFITDGPTIVGNNLVGDNASGQERVTVEPLGGSDRGGSSRETFRLVGPGNELLGYIQRVGINNGGLHSSRGKRL